MATKRSPRCPSISLPEAIEKVRKVYNIEGRSTFDAEVAVKHMGYNGLNGASRRVLGAIRGYNLLEGNGSHLHVTKDAVTIIVDENASDQTDRQQALTRALKKNRIYSDLYDSFGDGSSELNIASYLQKNHGFKPDAAVVAARNYKDSISLIGEDYEGYDEDDDGHGDGKDEVTVGDTIQWTSLGVDQFPYPKKVRAIDESGAWAFVEGSTTGVPLDQISIIEKGGNPPPKPPEMPLSPSVDVIPSTPPTGSQPPAKDGEVEFSRGKLSSGVDYRLIVSGDMGAKEIGKLIKLLEAQKAILSDDED